MNIAIQQRITIARFYITGLLIFTLLQTSHYIWYFRQPVDRSLIWSVVDWGVWLLMFFALFSLKPWKVLSGRMIALVWTVISTFPFLHILVSSLVFYVIFGMGQDFGEDFMRQVSKRWFQNILITACLYMIFDYLYGKYIWTRPTSTEFPDQLVLKDGSTTLVMQPSEIRWITSSKNYIILQTPAKQIVLRGSLAEIMEKLNPAEFLKISRSCLVNKATIKSLEKRSRYSYTLHTTSGKQFDVGRTHLKSIRSSLQN